MSQENIKTYIETATRTEFPLAATSHDQSCKMMQQLYTDSPILWHEYADRLAHEELLTVAYESEWYQDERGAACWEIGNYTLKVFPIDTDEYISFVVFDVEEPVFVFPLDRTAVHLLVPFSHHDDQVAECTLNDEIYWINDGQVIAAGVIERVLHTDVIITSGGLIVPVIVKPFVYRFKPFALEDAIEEDHQDAFRAFITERDSMSMKPESVQQAISQHDAKIPSVAVTIHRALGLDILVYIDDGYVDEMPGNEVPG